MLQFEALFDIYKTLFQKVKKVFDCIRHLVHATSKDPTKDSSDFKRSREVLKWAVVF
jgi:hypothetical protein